MLLGPPALAAQRRAVPGTWDSLQGLAWGFRLSVTIARRQAEGFQLGRFEQLDDSRQSSAIKSSPAAPSWTEDGRKKVFDGRRPELDEFGLKSAIIDVHVPVAQGIEGLPSNHPALGVASRRVDSGDATSFGCRSLSYEHIRDAAEPTELITPLGLDRVTGGLPRITKGGGEKLCQRTKSEGLSSLS